MLFLAMVASDQRKAIFYADLLLVPMMVRLAVQYYHGKPYGLGIWNTPFLRDLYPKGRVEGSCVGIRKRSTRPGSSTRESSSASPEDWGPFKKCSSTSDVFNLELSATQWLLFKLFSIIPEKTLRQQVSRRPGRA